MTELPAEREQEQETTGTPSSPALTSPDEFTARVDRIMALIASGAVTTDRLIVETYVQMSEASTFFREMQSDFAKMGPGGILKMLRGKS